MNETKEILLAIHHTVEVTQAQVQQILERLIRMTQVDYDQLNERVEVLEKQSC